MAWDATKPANNSALVSSEIRANEAAVEAAIGNPDTTPLTIKQADLAAGARFAGPPTFKPGASAAYDGTISGRVSGNITTVGNVGAGTDPLMSDIVKADWLNANLKAYRYTGGGFGANNANNKT